MKPVLSADFVEPLVAWCEKHKCAMSVYDDGSKTCMHELIVEAHLPDCRPVPIPTEYRYKRRARRQG